MERIKSMDMLHAKSCVVYGNSEQDLRPSFARDSSAVVLDCTSDLISTSVVYPFILQVWDEFTVTGITLC
jgi:hypothetical protein